VNFLREITRALALAGTIALLALALPVAADEMRKPVIVKCVYVSSPISFQAPEKYRKMFSEITLERGPYVTESENDAGVFYRGPMGALRAGQYSNNGGFWVPKDPEAPPRLYMYSQRGLHYEAVPEEITCASTFVIDDPQRTGDVVVAFAAGGALGGAAGRALVPGGPMTYGQAALGGMIGMAIIGAIIGPAKAILLQPLDHPESAARLKELAGQAVTLEKRAPPPQ
jgi:hypothetical protein